MQPNMQLNVTKDQDPVPTHKHLALWTILFVVLLAVTLLFWVWSSRNPVGGNIIRHQYNTQLNTDTNAGTATVNTQVDAATQALENDINSSLDLEVESDLKSIDLEF